MQQKELLDVLNLHSGWRKVLEKLIKNQDDLDDFIINYWDKYNHNEIISVNKYFKQKIMFDTVRDY